MSKSKLFSKYFDPNAKDAEDYLIFSNINKFTRTLYKNLKENNLIKI